MSPLLVQKYGGTSVGDTDRIRAVADHIAHTVKQGNSVVVVVSAMGKMTDDLIRQANEVSSTRPGREMDMLLTAGERISSALLCMALADRNIKAISFTGSQAGIITDSVHGKAKIQEIKSDRLQEAISQNAVAVVAGFQGVSSGRDITTLGRGGSDTSAVAIAAVMNADVCEIYTDVSGVFSADPRVVPSARKISRTSFDEMLEIAATGGRVLALRSVETAKNHHVPLHVRSSFTWEPGTWITEEENDMEQAVVTAVTHDEGEAKVTIAGVADRPGIAAKLFRTLADTAVNVDMIVQNVSVDGKTDISFTVPSDELDAATEICENSKADLGADSVITSTDIGRVSLVGAGMKSHPGVAAQMFETLAKEDVNIQMISTSSIRISCVVKMDDVERAVRALHDSFKLDAVRELTLMNIGIVGATGLVGTYIRDILEERQFPVDALRLFASSCSAGQKIDWKGTQIVVEDAEQADFSGLDIVLMSAGGDASRAMAERIAAAGAKVVDNSSAWRMNDDVPLVVTEVNPETLAAMPKGIVANPNCTTMVCMPVLGPLHKEFTLTNVVASTYQAVSGTGGKGIAELATEVDKVGSRIEELTRTGESVPEGTVYPKPIAFNVISIAGNIIDTETDEEKKFRDETRKILGIPSLSVSCTCVRVPVITGHSVSIQATFANSVDLNKAKEILKSADGVELADIPNPLDVTGKDVSQVGRLRSTDDPNTISLFVSGDNLRKGAALNAVQIAELLVP